MPKGTPNTGTFYDLDSGLSEVYLHTNINHYLNTLQKYSKSPRTNTNVTKDIMEKFISVQEKRETRIKAVVGNDFVETLNKYKAGAKDGDVIKEFNDGLNALKGVAYANQNSLQSFLKLPMFKNFSQEKSGKAMERARLKAQANIGMIDILDKYSKTGVGSKNMPFLKKSISELKESAFKRSVNNITANSISTSATSFAGTIYESMTMATIFETLNRMGKIKGDNIKMDVLGGQNEKVDIAVYTQSVDFGVSVKSTSAKTAAGYRINFHSSTNLLLTMDKIHTLAGKDGSYKAMLKSFEKVITYILINYYKISKFGGTFMGEHSDGGVIENQMAQGSNFRKFVLEPYFEAFFTFFVGESAMDTSGRASDLSQNDLLIMKNVAIWKSDLLRIFTRQTDAMSKLTLNISARGSLPDGYDKAKADRMKQLNKDGNKDDKTLYGEVGREPFFEQAATAFAEKISVGVGMKVDLSQFMIGR